MSLEGTADDHLITWLSQVLQIVVELWGLQLKFLMIHNNISVTSVHLIFNLFVSNALPF